ncbi:nucleotide sugar dehydrogenase [Candidatus Peribacteria bacterium]|nr:nucleotide sugar dehydrogenase [Candidatus Peribacteria bacterium]
MKLAIVGLGYVGLPLAHAFAKAGHDVVGYDISEPRITELQSGKDRTLELSNKELKAVTIQYTMDAKALEDRDVIILALPTPVNDKNDPDLTILESATKTVGKHLKKGMVVVYESTVYPGVTEEVCGPILEKESGLTCGTDFMLGYSPERVNPGDREHTIDKIMKVVAGQDDKTTDMLCELYGSIVTAGIHRAGSIKVAEMAKAIENAQRDLNIAYINEIAMLCNGIGIPTKDVLAAAGTKWNFLKFQPGLVGGHCIGVDPYYLVEKAKKLKQPMRVISASRAVNDGMSGYVVDQIEKEIPKNSRILILGLTFKENIPDTRNSKAMEVAEEFAKRGFATEVHDPFLTAEEIKKWKMTPGSLDEEPYDAIVFLVPHKEYLTAGVDGILKALKKGGVVYDLKSLLDGEKVKQAGAQYLAL